MADSLGLTEPTGFRGRVEESFFGLHARLVLGAHGCVVERLGQDEAEQTRAADILLSHHAEPEVIAAALLIPLRRRGCIEPDELRSLFGEGVASLVEMIFREGALHTDTDAQWMAYLRLFLEANVEDIRVMVLRTCLRLAELETLAAQNDEGGSLLARETLELYVPLADRLGMGILQARLEDACFHVLQPLQYDKLARAVELQWEEPGPLALLQEEVQCLLERNGIAAAVHGRVKGLYSLFCKMCLRHRSLAEVMDRLGLRVVVPSVVECYTALELLHGRFEPIPGLLDDYIRHPKANGYQSLHTCVHPLPASPEKVLEIQIRTEQMHLEAQYGLAAHWRYRDEKEAALARDGHVLWFQSMLARHAASADRTEFLEHLSREVSGAGLLIPGSNGWHIRPAHNSHVQDLEGEWVESAGAGDVARIRGDPETQDHSSGGRDLERDATCG